ncbi:MAG: EamA/RhaT family transporter [Verrucomicrobia bacterium]|nr:EamA/RhaT family transporter [Verrucomicrobiota bacterium]
MTVWPFLIVRVVSNPCSNALQKWLAGQGVPSSAQLLLVHLGLSLVTLSLLLRDPLGIRIPGFWGWCGLSAALAVAANWLIIEALRRSDLSLLGPINAFKPVVSLLPGWILLGEPLGIPAAFGILLVLAGSLLLTPPRNPGQGSLALLGDRGVQLRFLALILSAGEAVTLKRALRLADPLTVFAAWCLLGLLILLPIATRSLLGTGLSRTVPTRRRQSMAALGLVTTTGLMQSCTLITLAAFPVGAALALYQTSSILTVLLGHAVFQEPHFRRRLGGALVMATGAALLVLQAS